MTCTANHLAALGPEIEGQLKPNLNGLFGGVVRGYLPQTWKFVTELDTASLVVDRAGNVKAYAGAVPGADVTITLDHARLEAALRTRDKNRVPPGSPPQVAFHTPKGKTAFGFLRGRLGL